MLANISNTISWPPNSSDKTASSDTILDEPAGHSITCMSDYPQKVVSDFMEDSRCLISTLAATCC